MNQSNQLRSLSRFPSLILDTRLSALQHCRPAA